jgi:hypothetical protein
MLKKTVETTSEPRKSKADTPICLSPATIIDNVEVRLAQGITCPYCHILIRNDPHPVQRGLVWVCPNGHTVGEVYYR